MFLRHGSKIGIAATVLLSACAQQEEAPVLYEEPVFDKFGVASCRPPNAPVDDVFPAYLPLCKPLSGPGASSDSANGTVNGNGDIDDDNGNQNRNRNQNQNQNEENNQNRGG